MHLRPHRTFSPVSIDQFRFRDTDASLKRRIGLYSVALVVLVGTWLWGSRSATLIQQVNADESERDSQAFATARASAIKEYDGDSLAFLNWAVKLDDANKRDLAIQVLEEATRRDPAVRDTQLQLGYLYLQDGQVADAAAAFLRAKQLDPIYPVTYQLLAKVYELQGNKSQATEALGLAKRFEKVPNL